VKANSLQELYIEQLQDLYSAENQIIKALPTMIESAQSDELRNALNEHLEVTRNQAARLEQIFEKLGEEPGGEKCKGMEGVLKEGSDVLKEVSEEVMDAAIIASAQRVEHYEMAAARHAPMLSCWVTTMPRHCSIKPSPKRKRLTKPSRVWLRS